MDAPAAIDYSPTSITIDWETLQGQYTGDGPILSYEVYWDNGTGGNVNTPVRLDNVLSTSFASTALNTASEYQYKVRAVNKCGAGEFSEIA